MCPECHDTGSVRVVSQDPATGEWTHWIEVRCGECRPNAEPLPDRAARPTEGNATARRAVEFLRDSDDV